MSAISVPNPPGPSPEPVFRLSVEQYHAMIQSGVLTDDDPVELLEGILVFKIPKNPKHRITIAKLQRALGGLISKSMSLQSQDPITLADGEPEPDVVVIKGQAEDYPDRHPGPGDVHLVVEVADSSLPKDRGIKLRSYARAGIGFYWIVDLINRTIEVCSDPDSHGSSPTYRKREVFDEKSTISLELAGKKLGAVPVQALLP